MKNLSIKLSFIFFILIISISVVYSQSQQESDDFSYPLKLYNQEFYDLAAQQFVKFYNRYPNSSKVAEARFYAGLSNFKLEEYEKARIEFQAMAIELPSSKRAAEAWLRTGISYQKLGNLKDAAKSLETIRLLHPNSPYAEEGLFKSGLIYIQLKNYENALHNLNIILDRYSSSSFYVQTLVKAAYSSFKLNNMRRAHQLINKALDSKPEPETRAEALYILANLFINQGNPESAKKIYSQIISEYPNSSQAIIASLDFGRILIQEGYHQKAQQQLKKGLDRTREKEYLDELHLLLGDSYYLSKKYALAEKEYKQVNISQNDTTWLIVQLKTALSKRKQNLHSAALDQLHIVYNRISSEKDPLSQAIQRIYLNWLIDRKEYPRAISILYEQISNISSLSKRVDPTMRLVHILHETKRWRDITRELQPFLLLQEKLPERDDILYFLGLAHDALGNYDESAYYYNRLITEYSATDYYEKAKQRLDFLNDNNIINKDLAVNQLASLVGKIVDRESSQSLKFDLGKIYFNDLKDYKNASKNFRSAIKDNPANIGDIYLYLGKIYLKFAQPVGNKETDNRELLEESINYFKLAVRNDSTCSSPDEAAWFLVKTNFQIDTLSTASEKKHIEALIKKYPESELKEAWYKNLAVMLAFDQRYHKQSAYYFKKLVTEYKQSKQYPAHALGYAELMQGVNSQESLDYYKIIASEYPNSHEAVRALFEVASSFEQAKKYKEANLLYSRLLDSYYYSGLADNLKQKIGQVYYRAGDYEKAISVLNETASSPFIKDYLLAREFMPENLNNNIYYLAGSYAGKGLREKAVEYYNLYLNIALKSDFRDQARFNLGTIYYEQNQKETALEFFLSVSEKDSRAYKQANSYIAEIYFGLGEYSKAVNTYLVLEKMITDRQILAEIYGKHIISLLRSGKLKQANTLIKQYKNDFPDEKNYRASFVLEYGKHYRINKQFDKAIRFFEEVKSKYKSTDFVDDADYYLALTYSTLNKSEKAFKILNNFYNNYPKSDQLPAALNSLGSIYFRSEKYDDAIKMFKNALNICKDEILEQNITSNLIKAYSFTGFWDAAQATARNYITKFPEAADRMDKKITIGRSFINLNQFQNAVDYLKKVKLEADSDTEPEIQYYIGEAYLKAGQYENAIAEFVKIPLLSKKTKLQWEASALYYSGQAYEKLGRINDAVRMYQEIIRRPGIEASLKNEAQKRIKQIQS